MELPRGGTASCLLSRAREPHGKLLRANVAAPSISGLQGLNPRFLGRAPQRVQTLHGPAHQCTLAAGTGFGGSTKGGRWGLGGGEGNFTGVAG